MVAAGTAARHRLDAGFRFRNDATSKVAKLSISDLCDEVHDSMRATCFGYTTQDAIRSTMYPTPTYGLEPNDLSALYAFPTPEQQERSGIGSNQVVGIVVAYNYPNLESDLASYRRYFGLPPCTMSNGCLKIVGASTASASSVGSTAYSVSANPTTNLGGWAAEVDADTQVVSATCRNCKIVVAEAASDSLSDLGAAVRAADAAGATVINASFGAREDLAQARLESLFVDSPRHVKLVAASGDSGPGVYFPAASTNAIAVAGTSLAVGGWTVDESLWKGSGYGCSAIFAKPSWQVGSCAHRSVADVAAIADPSNGIWVYNSRFGGWSVIGGTSVAAPVIAALEAMSSNSLAGTGASRLYANRSSFLNVIPTTDDGDVATGLGVPQGLGGF
jgi:subtilase family serine protease